MLLEHGAPLNNTTKVSHPSRATPLIVGCPVTLIFVVKIIERNKNTFISAKKHACIHLFLNCEDHSINVLNSINYV